MTLHASNIITFLCPRPALHPVEPARLDGMESVDREIQGDAGVLGFVTMAKCAIFTRHERAVFGRR